MKKIITTLFLIFSLLFPLFGHGFAGHQNELSEILFGKEENFYFLSEKES